MNEPFGWELQLDLQYCNLEKLRSKEFLQEYVDAVVEAIGMKKFGDLIVEHFGHANPKTSGFTFVQLIETSNISGHLSEDRRSAHINIFSCAQFDVDVAINLTAEMFECRQYTTNLFVRK